MNDKSQPSAARSLQGQLKSFANPRAFRFWAVVAVVVYALAGFFLAPWLIERTAVNSMAEIDRTLTIGKIKTNPFTLTLDIADLDLKDTDGEPLFSWKDLFINFQLSSLFRWAWTFNAFQLDGLSVNFELFETGDGRVSRFLLALLDSTDSASDVLSGSRTVSSG